MMIPSSMLFNGDNSFSPERMTRFFTGIILSFLFSISIQNVDGRNLTSLPSKVMEFINSEVKGEDGHNTGTKWAVLIAGSMGFVNYRHQADVCHAYQIMRKGGLRDENIIVFMYDDIASNKRNPTPGIIINKPNGHDVYKGVPKDYTGKDVNIDNFFAVLLGNKTALKGGSGKVVDSGPHDHIFVYYSDHGSPGALGLPGGHTLYAHDLIDVLKKKHASGTYKSLVFYLEACYGGSIFEGLLPEGINIYATTASSAKEDSYGTYCSYQNYPCLGDMYSVSWMEDSDRNNLRTETLEEQYERVKRRTLDSGSHVQQYGNLGLSKEHVAQYMGTNGANDNSNFTEEKSFPSLTVSVKQLDADLLYLWHKLTKSPEGSRTKLAARKRYVDAMSHRVHIDQSVKLIAKLMFGTEKGLEVLNAVRPRGRPLVDDWDCFKAMVRSFETHCGSLYQYGRKHMFFLANICNEGMKVEQMAQVSAQACGRMGL